MSDEKRKEYANTAIIDFSQKYSALNQDTQDWLENIVAEPKKGYLGKS